MAQGGYFGAKQIDKVRRQFGYYETHPISQGKHDSLVADLTRLKGDSQATEDTRREAQQTIDDLARYVKGEEAKPAAQTAAPSRREEPKAPSAPSRPAQRYGGKGRQKTYTSVSEGDVVEVVNLKKSKRGDDYFASLGHGNNMVVYKAPGLEVGWSGRVKVVSQGGSVYFGEAILEAAAEPAKAEPKYKEKQPPPEAPRPAKTPPPKAAKPKRDASKAEPKPKEKRYVVSLGDFGATEAERAAVYVPAAALDQSGAKALEILVTQGQPVSPQGQPVLEAMRAHVKSGRPIWKVGDEVPDEEMTLREYLQLYEGEGGLTVQVDEKPEVVKPAAAAEIVDRPRPSRKPSKPSKPSRPSKSSKPSAPMPVSGGSRRHGALEGLVGSYRL